MHKLYHFGYLFAVILLVAFFATSAHASDQGVVISQIQLGDKNSAKNEFIELYNNSASKIDITNWCLYYKSASLKSEQLNCFTVENKQTHIFLPGNSTVLVVSSELASSATPLIGDLSFSATLSGTAGYLLVIDDVGEEVDMVGWGVATTELDLALTAPVGSVLNRKSIKDTNLLQDTNINLDDFEVAPARTNYKYGSIYELDDVCVNIIGFQAHIPDGYDVDSVGNCTLPPVDICPNIDGLQEVIPIGYGVDEIGDCMIDVCINLDGLQTILPDGMVVDEVGNCTEFDYCPNLIDIQSELPPGYYISDDGDCNLETLPLIISEILPNATGVDDGQEFIELYNPNNIDIELANYMFSIGLDDSEKYFEFPAESIIKAGQYLALYNLDINFVLKNTNDIVRLYSIDDRLIDEAAQYENPKAGEAWAKINDLWQYTNRPSPDTENLAFLLKEIEIVDKAEPELCGLNQYRNPETGRCKNIAKAESTLKPCKDGQYRSEETNRCRSIASDVVEYMPCAEGEERNPETNRCRSIASASVLGASDLAPCPEGQERNPETNRCRNVVNTIPVADYKITPVAQPEANNNVLWWSIGGVGIIAISYGVWEWRKEIVKLFRRFKNFFI